MIAALAQFFNILGTTIQSLFQVASFIGQVIVIFIGTSINYVFNSLMSALMFFQILYEDNIFIFTEELPNWATHYFETMHSQYSYVQKCVWILCSEIAYETRSIVTSINYIIAIVLKILFEVLMILKTSLLLLGNALWIILTFIPVHLPYLLKTFMTYFKESFVNSFIYLYKGLLTFTNFLSDVPLESFIGIMTAIAVVRFYLSYRIEIHSEIMNMYLIIMRKLLYMYHSVYNYFTNSDVRMITRMASGEAIMTRDANLDSDVDEAESAADALCVICQERQKCVLILPCKHVCLCRECCLRLYGYQRTCPICRTFIYHSVTIYL